MPHDGTPGVSRRKVLQLTGTAAGLSAVGGVATASPGRDSGPKSNEVLVGVSAGAGQPSDVVAQYVPDEAAVVHENETLRYVAVSFPDGSEEAQQGFIETVTEHGPIKYAEENGTYEALYTPDDPKFGDQYAPQQVNADDAWDTTLGSGDVTIAVVDTGIQYDHPDLDGNMSDADSNHGYDFVDDDEDPYPDVLSDEYHGTHVAGIAGAETDNGEGIAGTSESAILSCRALDESGSGSFSGIADAIEYATDQGADVINLSLGGSSGSSTLKNAVEYAYNNGVYLAAAAGNDGPCSDCVGYPAAYSECVAVSALDADETLASYSSTGSEVELAAPGTDVLSTTTSDRGDYEKLSGTSMATPVVSGVASLALDQWDLSNTDLRNHLNDTAVDVGLASNEQGNGRVDADNAVTTDPSGGGGGGTCGDTSTSSSVSDSLSDYTDSDCYYYNWEYSSPCQVVVELDGPSDADFDLYVNEGTGDCPTTSSYTHRSISTDSQEQIVIDDPDTSAALYMLVDSYSGSGDYTLTITEKTT
ncbi:S8 family serine peptidase [Haloparvum sp. PAK95]|uniref:S8 family serine peptidase n=1 Tax=Haloparvum sp. PAK95 TaxID=3418962 RepID=UPI003D2F1744